MKIKIMRDDQVIFTLYMEDKKEAELFCKYFNANIYLIYDIAVTED